MIKKLVLTLTVMLLLIIPVSAEETDLYKEQYSASGIDEIKDQVPDSARDFLNDFSINLDDSNWVNNLNGENAIKHIIYFIKSGAKAPFKTFGVILALIILSTLITSSV